MAAFLLAATVCFASSESSDALLHRADQIKLTNNVEFERLLQQLDAGAGGLSQAQRDWLDYLHAWQFGFRGQYPQAVAAFDTLLARPLDATLRARARISLLDDQINSAHYEDAYANVNALLDLLPHTTDHKAHFLTLLAASSMYNEAGQFELALRYIDEALAYDHSDFSICMSLEEKSEILYRSGGLRANDPQIRTGLDTCQRIGEPIFSNFIRVMLAQAQMDHGDIAEALGMLQPHDAEVLATRSSAFISMFRATIAKGLLQTGDQSQAEQYARSAIEHANQQVNSKASADAWQVLYQVAKRQGDDKNALSYLEKFSAADKGYLNDVSARALAYQMVHQQVLARKAQVATLSQQNQVLKLKQDVSRKNMIAIQLGIALLIAILGSIVLYAYRTKRSQLKFQKLAQRDGLTGIYNRQHFLEASEQALSYGARSVRDACVVTIDLDHFKNINDEHGHAAGDTVLKRVVAACEIHLRSVDVFGRFGGEEFGILMPDCVPERAADMAEQMRKAICEMSGFEDGPDFPVSASFGIAAARWSGYDLRQLLAHADSALYEAKRAGRNRVVMHRELAVAVGSNLPPGAQDRRRG